MKTELGALLANVRWLPAEQRAVIAEKWVRSQPRGTVLLATCHRVELYGERSSLEPLTNGLPPGVRTIEGRQVAEQLIRVAVGRDSSVIAEDQILHQLRAAATLARSAGGLPHDLDRLLDGALRAGRLARTWFPARRPSLVDLAIDRAANADLTGVKVLVVGTGEMGRAATTHLHRSGADVFLASRSRESARVTAERLGVVSIEFDPGPGRMPDFSGIVVALAGPWRIESHTRDAVASSGAWIVDISAPPALDSSLARAVRGRLVTIDDLAEPVSDEVGAQSGRLLQRLDQLVARTTDDFERWSAGDSRRLAAQALAVRSRDVRAAELERLWERVPSLSEAERIEVERAFDHAAATLLREPFEELGRDGDGRQAEAVRELFRL